MNNNQAFNRKFEIFKMEVLSYIKANAPYRTGNLRANITSLNVQGGFQIIIDVDYMVHTEEAWGFNKRWNKTLRNPNYKWLQTSVERLAQRFAQDLKGVVIRG